MISVRDGFKIIYKDFEIEGDLKGRKINNKKIKIINVFPGPSRASYKYFRYGIEYKPINH
jgi:hypothetical protein